MERPMRSDEAAIVQQQPLIRWSTRRCRTATPSTWWATMGWLAALATPHVGRPRGRPMSINMAVTAKRRPLAR